VAKLQAREGGVQAIRMCRGFELQAAAALRQVAGQAPGLPRHGVRDVDQ
jgi:hypothetical protein